MDLETFEPPKNSKRLNKQLSVDLAPQDFKIKNHLNQNIIARFYDSEIVIPPSKTRTFSNEDLNEYLPKRERNIGS